MTTPEWRHIVTPGYIDEGGRRLPLFVEIEYHFQRNHMYELTLTGVLGPKANGDAWGGCGQNIGDLSMLDGLYDGWTPNMVRRLHEIWDRWHLNGMRAGTPKQEEFLRAHRDEFPGYPISHYDWALAMLDRAGLQPDDGYSYGSAWLYEELPDGLLDEIWAFPTTHLNHPWQVPEIPRKERPNE